MAANGPIMQGPQDLLLQARVTAHPHTAVEVDDPIPKGKPTPNGPEASWPGHHPGSLSVHPQAREGDP